jgi:hypothetical protein fuD12_00370
VDFIEYITEKIHLDNSISIEENKIKIKEENNTSKLREVIINYKPEKYEVFLMTLDENNLPNKKKMFPYFKNDICSAVDYILFVKDKKKETFFIFHIELKSQKPKSKEILKKHITSFKTLNFILEMLYLKTLKEYKEENKEIEFPSKIYRSLIVLYKNSNMRNVNKIIENSYNMETCKGTLKKKLFYYTEGISMDSKNSNSKLNLKDLCEYFEKNIKAESVEICKKIYN